MIAIVLPAHNMCIRWEECVLEDAEVVDVCGV